MLSDVLKKHGVAWPKCGSDCREEWLPIVDRLIGDLIELGWDKTIIQIKEKFGGLRFYIGKSSDEIGARIRKAEEECDAQA